METLTPTLSLALVAGALATFNPCGFALLPAYLTVLVQGESSGDQPRPGGAVPRAVRFSLGMTVGFVAVFGAFGAIIAPLKVTIERYLPVLTVLMGLGLVLLGAATLAGRAIAIPGLIGRGAGPSSSWYSQVQYGVTFALASLSCTIGPFLAVTSGSLTGSGAIEVLAAFVTYAVGMGTVVLALALTAALLSCSVSARLRRAIPVITRVSGCLLLAAGTYVAWYGWFELRILSGSPVDDPVISSALAVQGAITRTVANAGATTLLIALAVLIAVSVAGLWRRRATSTSATRSAD